MENSIFADPARKPALDPNLYHLEGDKLAFFKEQTGIQDEENLKLHVLDVQSSAYEIYGYPCIRLFRFLDMGITRTPGYRRALSLPQKYADAIFLDIGCCFGVDIRKAVSDGWPVKNVIGSDLQQGFWNFGHKLFKSTPEGFPAAFVAGDAFDSNLIDPAFNGISDNNAPLPPLKELRSLSPLLHKISAIHATSLFHLFSEERQRELARRLLSLLKIRSGSIMFGMHCGNEKAGIWKGLEAGNFEMFCHSPDSWKKLWKDIFEEAGYDSAIMEVESTLIPLQAPSVVGPANEAPPVRFFYLLWSVTIV